MGFQGREAVAGKRRTQAHFERQLKVGRGLAAAAAAAKERERRRKSCGARLLRPPNEHTPPPSIRRADRSRPARETA